jgi:hypothetical protein
MVELTIFDSDKKGQTIAYFILPEYQEGRK